MNGPISGGFLCDPRVQLLSAQEESFLFRLLEARLRNDLNQYGGRFPTDPKLLRPIAYPHKAGPRDSFLQCLIAKLEQVRIATMIPPAPCAVFDLPPYLPIQSGEIIAPAAESPSGNGVIHIDGPGPPNLEKQIAVVAAAAANDFDLIEKLKPYFPRHDVKTEVKRFFEHRKKINRPPVPSALAKWMLRAEVPILRQPKAPVQQIALERPKQDEPDLFDQKFLREYERKKARASR